MQERNKESRAKLKDTYSMTNSVAVEFREYVRNGKLVREFSISGDYASGAGKRLAAHVAWVRKTRVLNRKRFLAECPDASNKRHYAAVLKVLLASGEIRREIGVSSGRPSNAVEWVR